MAAVGASSQAITANGHLTPSRQNNGSQKPLADSRDVMSASVPRSALQTPATNPGTLRKGKGKKTTDATDASKQIAAKIAQLEQDAAGEKDQEIEIGMAMQCYSCDATSSRALHKVLAQPTAGCVRESELIMYLLQSGR